ncbi:MAG: TolC family protein [Spirochaetaceae bacterium]
MKMNGKMAPMLTAFTAVLLLTAMPALSQESEDSAETAIPSVRVLNVEEALRLALESNLGIQSQEIDVAQKKLVRDSWWNRFYPEVSARASLGRMNEEQSTSGLAPVGAPDPTTGAFDSVAPFSEELPQWNLSTSLDISLTLTPALAPGISLAGLDLGASRVELEKRKAEIERDVQKSFYELLLTEEQVELTRERIRTAERRLEQTRLNYEAGLADEFTVLSARVDVSNLRPQLTQLQNGYQQAMMSFKTEIGVPLDEQVQLTGSIEPPAGVDRIREAIGSIDDGMLYGRFDIQGLEQQAAILEEQRRLNVYQSLPSLTLGFNVDPTFQGDPWEDSWVDGDLWEQRNGMFSISVAQPIHPWFPRSESRNEIKGVERQLTQNRLNLDQALTGAEIEVRSHISSIESSLESIEALELNVELAERAYDLADQAYENGLRDLTEVEQAEVDLQDARLQLIQEQQRVLASLLDLEYALNTTMEEFLQ